ncbi:MAG: discoidin domain-containing protein, partial [Verrucomicrobia bacterium]|nr:discoidin domain-containing protein [Verrucomicrobiota bacterium]
EPEAPHLCLADTSESARTYDGKVAKQRDARGMKAGGRWSLFRVPVQDGSADVSFTARVPELGELVLPLTAQPAPSSAGLAVTAAVLLQTTWTAPGALAIAAPAGELPTRWQNDVTRTLVLRGPEKLTLTNPRAFEPFAVQRGAKLFTDRDVCLQEAPGRLNGKLGARTAAASLAQSAAVNVRATRPVRVIALFNRTGPPAGWRLFERGAVRCTDTSFSTDLHYCDLPAGATMLCAGAKGPWVLLAAVPLPPNLALKKPVQVSSTHDAVHTADHVTDGKTDECWWSQNGLPQWASVDLGAPTTLNAARVVFYHQDDRSYQYVIEASADGAQWHTLVDARHNTDASTADGHRHSFPPAPARYVRVTVTSGRRISAAHIAEIELLNDPCPPDGMAK